MGVRVERLSEARSVAGELYRLPLVERSDLVLRALDRCCGGDDLGLPARGDAVVVRFQQGLVVGVERNELLPEKVQLVRAP